MFQGNFPRIGSTLLYDVDRMTMMKTRREDNIIVKYIRKFGRAWGDATLPTVAQKAWGWRERSAAYREKMRAQDEEGFKQSGVAERCNFMSKREIEVLWDEKAHYDCGYPPEYVPKPVPALMSKAALRALLAPKPKPAPTPKPQPALMPKPKSAPMPKIAEDDSTMSTIISVMSGFTDMVTATASELYTWFSGSSSSSSSS